MMPAAMRGSRASPEVQSIEARMVMDLRSVRNRSSPPHLAVPETNAAESSPRVAAARIFRCNRYKAGAAMTKPSQGSPHAPPRPPMRGPSGEGKGGVPLLGNTRVKPGRGVHGERARVVQRKALAGGVSLAPDGSPAIDEQQQQRQQQRRQQQQQPQQAQQHPRGVVSCGSLGGRPPGESVCPKSRAPLSDVTPAPFGSQEYIEKRSRRAARGEDAVRRLGQGLEKLSALISERGTRKAESLVRRLAAERKRTLRTSVTDSPNTLEVVRTNASKGQCKVRERKAKVGKRQVEKVERRPWRVGAPSEIWGGERVVDGKPRFAEGPQREKGNAREQSDPIKDHAAAIVRGVLRRACLNLANRPWRLAGVRLSIDSPSCTGKRRRATEARKAKAAAVAELVVEMTTAADRKLTMSGRDTSRAGGRGGERRHRRLVRPRTICTTSSADRNNSCGTAASPPFPQRGSDGYGVRPQDSCGRNCGEEFPLRPDTAYDWREESRAFSEDSCTWIPQLQALRREDDGDGTTGRGERGASIGTPGGRSPRCRTQPHPDNFFVANGTGLSTAPKHRHHGEERAHRRQSGATGDGRRAVEPSPRGSRSTRARHRKLWKRPKWDERFWRRAADASDRVRTLVRSDRSPSPPHVVPQHSPGAGACSGTPALIDGAHGTSNLAELKRKNILFEIGRTAAMSMGHPYDRGEIILSELCTVFVTSPSAELAQPKRLLGVEMEGDAFPWPRYSSRGSANCREATDGPGDSVEWLASSTGGEYLGGNGRGPASIPASRGLLLELVQSSAARESRARPLRHSILSPSWSEASIRASSGQLLDGKRACGKTTVGGDRGRDRLPASAPWVPQRPKSFSTRSPSRPTDCVPEYRDRANSFLVLTLGFLRRLVEQSVSGDDDFDGRPDLVAALENVPVLDADEGLHGRLVDEMSPTSYATLVTIVRQTFRLPPSFKDWSKDDGRETTMRKKCDVPHAPWLTFFGTVVRGVLATRGSCRAMDGIGENGKVDIFHDQHSSATNASVSDGGVSIGDASATSRSWDQRWETFMAERDHIARYQTGSAEITRMGGYDIAVLAEMQRANIHIEFPALVEDARTFARDLGRLAKCSRHHGQSFP